MVHKQACPFVSFQRIRARPSVGPSAMDIAVQPGNGPYSRCEKAPGDVRDQREIPPLSCRHSTRGMRVWLMNTETVLSLLFPAAISGKPSSLKSPTQTIRTLFPPDVNLTG